jgi:hypothetical protein
LPDARRRVCEPLWTTAVAAASNRSQPLGSSSISSLRFVPFSAIDPRPQLGFTGRKVRQEGRLRYGTTFSVYYARVIIPLIGAGAGIVPCDLLLFRRQTKRVVCLRYRPNDASVVTEALTKSKVATEAMRIRTCMDALQYSREQRSQDIDLKS